MATKAYQLCKKETFEHRIAHEESRALMTQSMAPSRSLQCASMSSNGRGNLHKGTCIAGLLGLTGYACTHTNADDGPIRLDIMDFMIAVTTRKPQQSKAGDL